MAQCTLWQIRDLHSKPHQMNSPFEIAQVFSQLSNNGSCRSANRQATTNIAQEGNLHIGQVLGIANEQGLTEPLKI